MIKYIVSLFAFLSAGVLVNGQTDIIVNDFTGELDTSRIYGDDHTFLGIPNKSKVTIENDMLRADYNWGVPSWYPRAVWYNFEDSINMGEKPVLEVRFMVEDNVNDSVMVQFDLYGPGAEPVNDTLRDMMETNGNSWEFMVATNKWYVKSSDFRKENRFYTIWWGGVIEPTRIDSSRIRGFEAFANVGDNENADEPGTLWIDYIKIKGPEKEKYYLDKDKDFGVVVYPSPAVDKLNFDAENPIKRIEIYKMTGERVYMGDNLNVKKLELNVSRLAYGVYILNVYDTEGGMASDKFIKH